MFILVYRLAMDARTRKGDGGAGGKYPSLLEDFLAGTASMARKRHLTSTARGFCGFCLMALQDPSSSVLPLTLLALPSFSRHGIV